MLEWETEQDPESTRKARIKLLISGMHRVISIQEEQVTRGKELSALGVPTIDALHFACAEIGGANVFLTTDGRLLRQAVRLARLLRVRVENPLTWVKEMDEK